MKRPNASFGLLVLAALAGCAESSESPFALEAPVGQAITIPLTELVFIDPDRVELVALPLLGISTSTQAQILGLKLELAALRGRLEMTTQPEARAAIQRNIDAATARLNALVPASAQNFVAAPDPGSGNVNATIESRDPLGGLLASFPLVLRPDGMGDLRSTPFVVVQQGGLILRGIAGGILFLEGKVGGTVITSAPGFADAVATVVPPGLD